MTGEESRQYLQSKVNDALGWEQRHSMRWATARLLATTALTLSGSATIDGVATSAGDIVIATAQTDKTQNGPWVAAAGAWSRPTSLLVGHGLLFVVLAGDTLANTIWHVSTVAFEKFMYDTSTVVVERATSVTTTLSGDRNKKRAIGVDTLGGALTLALPSDLLYEGLTFEFFDANTAGSFAAASLTVSGNGKLINNAASLLLVDSKSVELRYNAGSYNVWGI